MHSKRHNYKNLKIWQLGIVIANDISDILLEFPKHERYDLSSQISRCSVSMPSNIAEGSARTDKSFSHFIDIFQRMTMFFVQFYEETVFDFRRGLAFFLFLLYSNTTQSPALKARVKVSGSLPTPPKL